jgi:dienelactone hydrolase
VTAPPSTGPERLHVPDLPGCLFPTGAGVTAWWYRPERPGPRASAGIAILPIQGGDYSVSRHFAERFSRAGFHALRFERRAEWLEAERPLDRMATLARQYVADVLHGLDLWLAKGAFDPERLGLFGVSMGAAIGTAVAARSEKVKATVLCIGGGPLAEVLLTADDEEVNRFRADVARRLGVPEPAIRPHVEAALEGDTLFDDARRLDPSRVLMFGARFDRVVRWPRHQALWEAAGRPRRVVLPCGHYSTAAFVPLVRRMSARFFDRHLVDGGR